jgi:hypothetical protein
MEAISGLHMFVSGPHNQQQELNFSDPVEFGHYNPKFLDWVDDHIIPITDDDLPFKNAVRPVYTAYIGPTARVLFRAHEILFATPQGYKSLTQNELSDFRDL